MSEAIRHCSACGERAIVSHRERHCPVCKSEYGRLTFGLDRAVDAPAPAWPSAAQLDAARDAQWERFKKGG